MKKIITQEQAEGVATYVLQSNIPSKDAQMIATLLRGLPAMSETPVVEAKPEEKKE